MRTFAKIYEINSEQNENQIGTEKKLVIDVPNFSDFWFPYGTPNQEYLEENGYEIKNPEFLLQHTNETWDGQIVFGEAIIYNDYEDRMKCKREFIINRLLTLQEYLDE